MDAFVEVISAEKLIPLFDLPDEMRSNQVEVTNRPVKQDVGGKKPAINMAILEKFRKAAEAGEFKEHLKTKLAEGVVFAFDAQKIIDGTETEEERQERYRMEKRAWSEAVAERVK